MDRTDVPHAQGAALRQRGDSRSRYRVPAAVRAGPDGPVPGARGERRDGGGQGGPEALGFGEGGQRRHVAGEGAVPRHDAGVPGGDGGGPLQPGEVVD